MRHHNCLFSVTFRFCCQIAGRLPNCLSYSELSVSKFLQQSFIIKDEEHEFKRVPPSLGRNRIPKGRKWSQFGDLRGENGAPLGKSIG